jgi:hypothetical protein
MESKGKKGRGRKEGSGPEWCRVPGSRGVPPPIAEEIRILCFRMVVSTEHSLSYPHSPLFFSFPYKEGKAISLHRNLSNKFLFFFGRGDFLLFAFLFFAFGFSAKVPYLRVANRVA